MKRLEDTFQNKVQSRHKTANNIKKQHTKTSTTRTLCRGTETLHNGYTSFEYEFTTRSTIQSEYSLSAIPIRKCYVRLWQMSHYPPLTSVV